MSAQPGLFAEPPTPGRRRGLLAALNPEAASYARCAAELIARLEDAPAIERALQEIAPGKFDMVLTLAIMGMALRIAQLPELEARRYALSKLPPDIQLRAAPHVKRLFEVKPWLKNHG